MKYYLIRSIATAWLILLCLQSGDAREINVDQTKKDLLETLQNGAVDKRRQMELYVDLYDLSDDETGKLAYIKKALELAVRQKDQTYIFETLDILCRDYKDDADSLRYYWRMGEEHLKGCLLYTSPSPRDRG